MKKPKVFYVYDALCGWCYGFGRVMKQFYADYKEQFDFEVISGGMITGDNVRPISGMAEYIRHAMPRLEHVSGVEVGEPYKTGILDKGTYITNSLPPSVALVILKEQAPGEQVPLARAIQHLHFVEGKDLNEVETYLPLAKEYGLAEADFKKKFTDEQYAARAQEEFELVQRWKITGFPAVVLQKGEQLYLVARGYLPYDQLQETVNKVLKE